MKKCTEDTKNKCKFKKGQLVKFKTGDDNLYEIYAIYTPRKVSLGLTDFPDVEQDSQVSTGKLRLAKMSDILDELDKNDGGRYYDHDPGCEGYMDDYECCGNCGGMVFKSEDFKRDIKRLEANK